MPTPSHRLVGWAGYGAAVWALIFTLLHGIWAVGWYIGLQEAHAQWAFQRTWTKVYNLVIVAMCGLAVVVALALVQPWGRALPRRLLSLLMWCGTGLLVLRGGGGLVKTAYLIVAGKYTFHPMHLYDVWFCLGAVLFGLSLWHFRRASRTLPETAEARR
jgi:hypothetical protein